MWVLLLRVLAMTDCLSWVVDQVCSIRNYIGKTIDEVDTLDLQQLNDLWHWLDTILDAVVKND